MSRSTRFTHFCSYAPLPPMTQLSRGMNRFYSFLWFHIVSAFSSGCSGWCFQFFHLVFRVGFIIFAPLRTQKFNEISSFFWRVDASKKSEKGKNLQNGKWKTRLLLLWETENLTVLSYFLPTCPVSSPFEKAALRRRICPQIFCCFSTTLLDLKTGGVLYGLLLPFMVSRSYLRWWCLAQKGRAYPANNPFRMLSESTSIMCCVFPGIRFLHTRKNSRPSSHNPPTLVRMNGRHEDSVKRRPSWSLRG